MRQTSALAVVHYTADAYGLLARLGANCEHCSVRQAMQQKYLLEAYDLYGSDFHIVKLPLKTEEVRGADKIKEFSKVRRRRRRALPLAQR